MKSVQFKKILLAEDNLILLDTLKSYFEEKFEHVIVAADGAEAYIRARDGDYDLIFSDIHMPGMTGLEVATRLRSEGHLTPIILSSTSLDDKILLQALRLGVNEFIEKPYSFDTLTEVISRVLEIIRRQNTINKLSTDSSSDQQAIHKHKKILGLLRAVGAEKKKKAT